jgi:hypothetical protein
MCLACLVYHTPGPHLVMCLAYWVCVLWDCFSLSNMQKTCVSLLLRRRIVLWAQTPRIWRARWSTSNDRTNLAAWSSVRYYIKGTTKVWAPPCPTGLGLRAPTRARWTQETPRRWPLFGSTIRSPIATLRESPWAQVKPGWPAARCRTAARGVPRPAGRLVGEPTVGRVLWDCRNLYCS